MFRCFLLLPPLTHSCLAACAQQVTLFTRGKTPIATQIPDDTPESFAKFKAAIKHVAGDRLVRPCSPHFQLNRHLTRAPSQNPDAVKTALQGHKFDVVYDLNGACCPHRHCSSTTPHSLIVGREAAETQSVLDACPGVEQYIYCSSAGVYLKSDQMPHMEGDAVR